jgi:tetratricopeptide (TPR) repeat protein
MLRDVAEDSRRGPGLPRDVRSTARETRARFEYQDACVVLRCIPNLPPDGLIAGVVIEWTTDYVVLDHDGRMELVSVKHREQDQRPWTFSDLVSEHVFRDLHGVWRELGEDGDYVFESSRGIARTLRATVLSATDPRTDAAAQLAVAVGISPAEAARFATHLILPPEATPDRGHIREVAAARLAAVLPQLGLEPGMAPACVMAMEKRVAEIAVDRPPQPEQRIPALAGLMRGVRDRADLTMTGFLLTMEELREIVIAAASGGRVPARARRSADNPLFTGREAELASASDSRSDSASASPVTDMVPTTISDRAKPTTPPGFLGGDQATPDEPRFRGTPPQVWWKVPARNPNFTGRQAELEAIGTKLAAEPVAVVAVLGLGGVGKSQLGAEYAHRMRESGEYEVVGWIRSDSRVTAAEDLAGLAPQLGLPADGPAGEVAAQVVTALGSGSNWLVVFDNAQAPEDVIDLLPGGGGHVLITSRNRGWSGIAQQVDLEVFTRAESVTFLRQRTGRDEPDAAAELADELGDLPLALAQAAAYVDLRGMTISSYLDLYRDPAIARRLRDEGLESYEYPASVARTWLLHFDELRREQPAAVDLLRLCAFLDPDDIDLGIFTDGAEMAGEALAAALGDRLTRVDLAGALVRASLITISADERLRVHRLVQAVTRDQLGDDLARVWSQRALLLVATAFPDDPQDHERWPVCASLAAHVEAVVMHTETRSELAARRGVLLGDLGIYLGASGQYLAARATQVRALTIKEAAYGLNHLQVGGTLSNLGVVQHRLGDLQAARASLERALAIKVNTLGPNHPVLAMTLSNLGNVQHQQGDLSAAHTSLQRALTINVAARGLNHPDVALTLTNLGLVQRDRGDLQSARASQERALAIYETVHGPDHLRVATTLGNLGNVQRQLRDREAARASLERALAIFETACRPDHPDIAATLTNLGLVQHALGSPETGRAHLDRALAITETIYGPDHPEIASILTGLGLIQRDLGELDDARAHLDRALAISETVYGPDHPKITMIHGILSDVRRRSDDL